MEINKTKHDEILSIIGLKRHRVSQAPNFYVYDSKNFKQYIPSDYRGSEREKADEIYRMSEFVLIHKILGLRIIYLTSSFISSIYRYNPTLVSKQGKNVFVIALSINR